MADQYEVVTRLLQSGALTDWHVVEPMRGDVRSQVLIQNAARKKAYVPISQADVDDLSDTELLTRLRTAIWNALREPKA